MSDAAVSRTIEAIDHVDLRVPDVGDAVAFYSGVVGLEIHDEDEHAASVGTPDGHTLINLSSREVTSPADPTAAGLFHTAIRFPTRPALGRALARVAEAGLALGAADHGVSEALYIDDPGANGVELYWDRPRDVWPSPDPGERVGMYSAPLDLNDLLKAGHDDDSTRAPAGTDIGHVHLQATDIEVTTSYYEDVLGFDLMARYGAQASFLASQGYHHHIGANIWRSRGKAPAGPESAGLSRIVFGSDPTELTALASRLEQAGQDQERQGSAISVTDPNGVELTFDPNSG